MTLDLDNRDSKSQFIYKALISGLHKCASQNNCLKIINEAICRRNIRVSQKCKRYKN